MVRRYVDRPVPTDLVDHLLDLAVRAPSAGFSQGWAFVVLEGVEQTSVFWSAVADERWTAEVDSKGWHLAKAPVVIVPLANKQAYLDRYAEPDKAHTGMADEAAWPIPFWLTDVAFATEHLLLGATDAGLGALFFGLPSGHERLLAALGVPVGHQALGAVALGWPDPQDAPSPSLQRGRRPLDEVVHRGGWSGS